MSKLPGLLAADAHYVYIFAHTESGKLKAPVKVGITSKPPARLATVQTGSPHKLEIAYVFAFPNRAFAKAMEDSFHEEASADRLHGEWFSTSPYEALKLLTHLIYEFFNVAMEEGVDRSTMMQFAQANGLSEAMKFVAEREGWA